MQPAGSQSTVSPQNIPLLSLLVLLATLASEQIPKCDATDPCGNHKVIDDFTRQPSQICYGNDCNTGTKEYDLIKNSHTKWFRFKLNGTDAQVMGYCDIVRRCNTAVPIWFDFKEAIPAAGKEISGTLCGIVSKDDCCWADSRKSVKLRNCGSFLVYRIEKVICANCRICVERRVTDPCNYKSYEVIDDPTRRPGHWNKCYGAQCHNCDKNSVISGWYRFKLNGANAQLPDHCVDKQQCNTVSPLWLHKVDVPVAGEEVTTKLCANVPGCCKFSYTAKLMNCGSFLVYWIQRPKCCNCRICVEDLNECSMNRSICGDAKCMDTDGDYNCQCDDGYKYFNYKCQDIDECAVDPSICGNRVCVNNEGSYTCIYRNDTLKPRPTWQYVTAAFLLLLVVAFLAALIAVYMYPERCSGAVGKKKKKRREEDDYDDDDDSTDDEEENQERGGLKNKEKGIANSIGGLSRLTSNDGQSTSKSEFVPSTIQRSRSVPDTSSTSTEFSFITRYY